MDKIGKTERAITLIMVMALWLLAAMNSYIPEEAVARSENEYPGIIRFHVIANSNTEQDQELKLAVRDYVLPRLEAGIADEINKKTAEGGAEGAEQIQITQRYITQNISSIGEWAREYLRRCGYDYEVSTELGVRAIPQKSYGDIFFPAGNYEALTITIGEGKGENWWCVVFPPLCLIDGGESGGEDRLGDAAENRIVLKSKLRELLKSPDADEKSKYRKISTNKKN